MATVKKAAEVFGVSPCYLRRLCKAGKITFVNTGHPAKSSRTPMPFCC